MLLLLAATLTAQVYQLSAPPRTAAGDLVTLRLTRDGLPLAGATIRVTSPAREIARVTAARLTLRDNRTTLFRADQVLVTSAGETDCQLILSSGANAAPSANPPASPTPMAACSPATWAPCPPP
jgi:hypothetical protein